MNSKTSGEETPPALSKLEYGGSFNKALCTRLERHFSYAASDAEGQGKHALVVGLFGEWGCGKTLHLRHIHQHFERQLPGSKQDAIPATGLTLPVFFNAWRYETEDHLIIPLLKTTQHRLRKWIESQYDSVDKADQKFKAIYQRMSDTVVALASGFEGELGGEGAKLTFKPAEVLNASEDRQRKRLEDAKTHSDKLTSIYYDFETEMLRLTGRVGNGPKLNFLFLIDDLDRCLPESAVKMLESIKLFLDVEGCAFVLALDDEVVERGIAHRYREYGLTHNNRAMESIAHSLNPEHYREFASGHDRVHANPITGHEYLEKIVQLPVRLPAPSATQVEVYLKKHFPSLFGDTDSCDGT